MNIYKNFKLKIQLFKKMHLHTQNCNCYCILNFKLLTFSNCKRYIKQRKTEQHIKLMMAWVMPKYVFKKLYRELKMFVNTVIVTKLWQCYRWNIYFNFCFLCWAYYQSLTRWEFVTHEFFSNTHTKTNSARDRLSFMTFKRHLSLIKYIDSLQEEVHRLGLEKWRY